MDKHKYCEIQVNSEPKELERNTNINLEYYLIEEVYKSDDNDLINTYGIEIIKRENMDEHIVNVECEVAPHLSISKSKVEKIIELLCKNTVTPMSLYNVLDNLIGVYY